MVFNSYTFLIFFVVVLAIHHLPISWRLKKLNLLLASYLFYAAWNVAFVPLLWISTLVDWFVGRRLTYAEGSRTRRSLLVLSLCVNLGLLGFFKYGGFLLDGAIRGLALLGISYAPAAPSIVLPVGISFYTFQTLSYTLDIYFRKIRRWDSSWTTRCTSRSSRSSSPGRSCGRVTFSRSAPRRCGGSTRISSVGVLHC